MNLILSVTDILIEVIVNLPYDQLKDLCIINKEFKDKMLIINNSCAFWKRKIEHHISENNNETITIDMMFGNYSEILRFKSVDEQLIYWKHGYLNYLNKQYSKCICSTILAVNDKKCKILYDEAIRMCSTMPGIIIEAILFEHTKLGKEYGNDFIKAAVYNNNIDGLKYLVLQYEICAQQILDYYKHMVTNKLVISKEIFVILLDMTSHDLIHLDEFCHICVNNKDTELMHYLISKDIPINQKYLCVFKNSPELVRTDIVMAEIFKLKSIVGFLNANDSEVLKILYDNKIAQFSKNEFTRILTYINKVISVDVLKFLIDIGMTMTSKMINKCIITSLSLTSPDYLKYIFENFDTSGFIFEDSMLTTLVANKIGENKILYLLDLPAEKSRIFRIGFNNVVNAHAYNKSDVIFTRLLCDSRLDIHDSHVRKLINRNGLIKHINKLDINNDQLKDLIDKCK